MIKVLPPKTAKEVVARERERKAKTTLLMALPEDHLEKFHKMADAKEMWEAIKSRFGGNDESKKMQKYLLKQQFKGFSVSFSEGLHKGYDRMGSLMDETILGICYVGEGTGGEVLEVLGLSPSLSSPAIENRKVKVYSKSVFGSSYLELSRGSDTTCESFGMDLF
nr:xylulose kinase-1 [Tanacetum cinerariifolium]